MERASKISIKNKIELSKSVKYGIIFMIGVFLVPGLVLNIPPVTVESEILDKDGNPTTKIEEVWLMSGRSSLLSGIVHLLLFMAIIFVIDYLF